MSAVNIIVLFVFSIFVSGGFAMFEAFKDNPELLKEMEACLKENALKPEDLPKDVAVSKPSDQLLCYYKCVMEKTGLLKDGFLDVDKLDEIPLMKKSEKYQKDLFLQCIKDYQPIKECVDLKPINRCTVDILVKKDK